MLVNYVSIAGWVTFSFMILGYAHLSYRIWRLEQTIRAQQPALVGSDPLFSKQETHQSRRFFQSTKKKATKVASSRLIPDDLFDLYPLWRRVFLESKDFLVAIVFLGVVGCFTWESIVWGPRLLGVDFTQTWEAIARAVVPTVFLSGIMLLGYCFRWPFHVYLRGFYWLGAGPIALYLSVWSVWVNLYDAGLTQFDYYPVLNPLDIVLAVVFCSLAWWIDWIQRYIKKSRFTLAWVVLVCLLGLWFTAMAARYVDHHWHIPFEWKILFLDRTAMQAICLSWGLFLSCLGVVWGMQILINRIRYKVS